MRPALLLLRLMLVDAEQIEVGKALACTVDRVLSLNGDVSRYFCVLLNGRLRVIVLLQLASNLQISTVDHEGVSLNNWWHYDRF